MTQTVFANNAATTLGSAIGPAATTITVATGTGDKFPTLAAGQSFTATLWASGSTTGLPNEIVKVTARVGDTMTVVRGQEGTTAGTWGVGDTFANYPTAGFYNNLLTGGDLQSQSGNSANDTGTANAGVIALSPAPDSLAALTLAPIRVLKGAAANTGAYTLNVNGFGAQPVRLGGNALQAGQLPASRVFEVVWSGSGFELLNAPALNYNNALAAMAAATFKGNITGAGAQPSDVPISALGSILNIPTLGPWIAGNDGYYYMPGGVLWQWGRYRFTTNITNTPYNVFYNIAFSAPAWSITTYAIDTTLRNYNQKKTALYGDGDQNKFQYTLFNDDSGDAGSYSYGFDWIAIGPA